MGTKNEWRSNVHLKKTLPRSGCNPRLSLLFASHDEGDAVARSYHRMDVGVAGRRIGSMPVTDPRSSKTGRRPFLPTLKRDIL